MVLYHTVPIGDRYGARYQFSIPSLLRVSVNISKASENQINLSRNDKSGEYMKWDRRVIKLQNQISSAKFRLGRNSLIRKENI